MNARASRWRACFAVGAATIAASCASGPTDPPSPLTNIDRGDSEGLVCVRYTLDTDAPRMEAVAAAFATRLFPTPDERAALAHEGLQVAIVPAGDLPDIRTRLGPLTEVTRVIVGQSANWVELAHRDLGADDLVMMDGAFMRGDGGALRISVRDAVMPDADGGCVQTEVAMHLTPATLPMQSLPGDAPAGRVVMQSAIECCLHDGEALLILPAPTVYRQGARHHQRPASDRRRGVARRTRHARTQQGPTRLFGRHRPHREGSCRYSPFSSRRGGRAS